MMAAIEAFEARWASDPQLAGALVVFTVCLVGLMFIGMVVAHFFMGERRTHKKGSTSLRQRSPS